MRRLLPLLLVLLVAPAALAHSYRNPELRTVLDEVRPPLPDGVAVSLATSLLDTLVLTNPTTAPLEVLSADGVPYVRISRTGVDANLSDPDWYLTAVPEGAFVPTRARAGAPPRWVRVNAGSTWSVFDPRTRPPVTVTPELRKAGEVRVLTSWSIPLRYDGKPVNAIGRVLLEPVRGAFVVATTSVPDGLTATPLQGELPGLFMSVPVGHRVEVAGEGGGSFVRFRDGVVEVWAQSPTWREDQRAAGHVVTGHGWVRAGRGTTFSWLDGRLRYPHDLPPDDVVGTRTVVRRWRVPVTIDGRAAAIDGVVTWVPRAEGLREVQPHREGRARWPWGLAAVGAIFLLPVARKLSKRRTMT